MLISSKPGIITNIDQFKTKEGKEMISISYTSWKSDTLQKSYIIQGSELFDEISFRGQDLLGKKIATIIEVLD